MHTVMETVNVDSQLSYNGCLSWSMSIMSAACVAWRLRKKEDLETCAWQRQRNIIVFVLDHQSIMSFLCICVFDLS